MSEKFRQEESEPIDKVDMSEAGMRVRRITNPDDAMVEQIYQLESACFPAEMMTDKEEVEGVLNTEGVHILIEDENGIFGHISAVDHNTEFRGDDKDPENIYIGDYDPDYKPEDNALYINCIDIIQGRNKLQGLGSPKALKMLWDKFVKEAVESGYEKATMYARIITGESDIVQKKLGGKHFRKMENWLDMGEDFDYLEIDLPEKENE